LLGCSSAGVIPYWRGGHSVHPSDRIPNKREDLHVLRPWGLQVKRDRAAALAEDLITDLARVHAQHRVPIDGVDDAVGLDTSSCSCAANLDILDEDFSMRPARQVQAYAHGLSRCLGIAGYRSSAKQRAAPRATMLHAHSMLLRSLSGQMPGGVWSEGGRVAWAQARGRAMRCTLRPLLVCPCGASRVHRGRGQYVC
jgi:hypothetical protein